MKYTLNELMESLSKTKRCWVEESQREKFLKRCKKANIKVIPSMLWKNEQTNESHRWWYTDSKTVTYYSRKYGRKHDFPIEQAVNPNNDYRFKYYITFGGIRYYRL